jgi:hypothetical protein
MKSLQWMVGAVCALTLGLATAADTPESWDGLVEIKPKRMDVAFLLPGADFRPYAKVMVDPTQVAFRKDWLEDVNRSKSPSRRIAADDAAEILAAARTNFDDVFHEAFAKAGYVIAPAPGPDVIRISAGVANLAIAAPMPDKGATGRSITLVADAGEATLVLELRDSQTGALLGRVFDRREARHVGGPVSSVSNVGDFRTLFRQWANIAVKGLGELKALSPVPADLKPKDKL